MCGFVWEQMVLVIVWYRTLIFSGGHMSLIVT